MLELVQFIIGIISKAIPTMIKDRKAGQLNEIGVELFLFYVRVNEVLMCGEQIVECLEVTLALNRGRLRTTPGRRILGRSFPSMFASSPATYDALRWPPDISADLCRSLMVHHMRSWFRFCGASRQLSGN